MGYWTGDDLPFYYALARTFPLADRWFGSVLAQTYPNRRFLLAGTAAGIVSTTSQALTAPPPPNGNIIERLDAHGIPWRNYYSDLPAIGVLLDYAIAHQDIDLVPIAQFFTDAAAGTLPAVCVRRSAFGAVGGESAGHPGRRGVRGAVINAAMAGPGWPQDVLIWFRRARRLLRPRAAAAAIAPDDIPPQHPPRLRRRLRPLWLPRARGRRLPVEPAPTTCPRVRDHTAILADRAQMEPAAADLPRRNAADLVRLPGPDPARLRRPASAGRAARLASPRPPARPSGPGQIPPPGSVTRS